MHAMDLLRKHGIVFGTSICYTRKNIDTVTSDEFLDLLIKKGVWFTWYFHYMPVGNDASLDLLPTEEQRAYMVRRVREIRSVKGGKPIFAIDFQNDGQFIDGCVAGGRNYCHINPNGDVEPCVFIHYSSANINNQSLLSCLQQPLFKEYAKGQPFNHNHLQHLCNKCKAYAVQWKPTADKLWAEIEANKEKEAAEKKVHSPQSATH